MARLALVDASAATATAVRAAAAGAHEVSACAATAVPAEADLVVVDAGTALPSSRHLKDLAAGRPLLLLLDRRAVWTGDAELPVVVLRKPCEIRDLRREIRTALEGSVAAAGLVSAAEPAGATPSLPSPEDALDVWHRPPLLPAAAAATLALARRLTGPVWIAGESGSGTDRVAAALAKAWDAGRAPVTWREDEELEAAADRLGDPARVLWVPALDARPRAEQNEFARFLALAGARRVVVTTDDDPTATGEFLTPSLHRLLSRVALRLLPLRERRPEIAALALGIASAVAEAAFGPVRLSLSDSARASLEAYDWPGNLEELDAVVTRSVLERGASEGLVHLDLGDLRYAPDFPSASSAVSPAASAGAPARRAQVLPLLSARSLEPASALPAEVPDLPRRSPQASRDASEVEAVLSAFAHDLRNPMATLKTFASLAAAEASGDSRELARLATGAADRIDAHLDFLQRYTELTGGPATKEPQALPGVDAVDVLGEAIEAAGSGLALEARSALRTCADPEALRFIADAIVAECDDRAGDPARDGENQATADLGADKLSLQIRIPLGGAAVDRLGTWVQGRGLPWRLALARDLARRGGGDLDMDVDDGEMRVRWTPAPSVEAEEEQRDGGQARSADRRRRSRSS
jgi:signal transduction histidine kinase